MVSRIHGIWFILIPLALGLSILYLWFTLFPGQPPAEIWHYFSAEQVEKGRSYSQAIRLCFIGNFLAQLSFLLWLVFSGQALILSKSTKKLAWDNCWIGLLLFFLFLWLILQLLNLPFAWFSDYYWQHQWGFSTQTLWAWCLDYLSIAGIELILSMGGILLLFWFLKRFPTTWWLYSAAFVSVWICILMFIFPILIAPLFNHFTPVQNQAITTMVSELSSKAGIPVDQVLVMDASRRTTKSNAYFVGLGQTKQIVLFDTLLQDYPQDEVKAVIAHEMGHWRQGHILQGLVLDVIAAFLLFGVLFIVLKGTFPLLLGEPYPAHAWAIILLFVHLVFFVSSPLEGYISRHIEAEADQIGIMLTNDIPAAVRLDMHLATKNAADMSPPPVIQWFSSHPAPLDRIKLIEKTSR